MSSLPIACVAAGLLAGLTVGWQPTALPSALPRLLVDAGDEARANAWVFVSLPSSVRGADLQLRDEAGGSVLPLQIGPYREAWARVPFLRARQTASFRIEPALRDAEPNRAVAVREVSRVRVAIDGHPAFTYVGEGGVSARAMADADDRGGYLHPVLTPSGRRVTDDAPPGQPHQHGIWNGWAATRVGGHAPDFWHAGVGTGRVEFERLGLTWSGPLTAGLVSRHRYMDLRSATPATVLLEEWRVVAYATACDQPCHVFDLEITQAVVGASPLELRPTREGGLGLRGPRAWRREGAWRAVTGRASPDDAGSRWLSMHGQVDGRPVGLAVLSHPDNVAGPEPIRIDPLEPFMAFVPQMAGARTVPRGGSLTLRYRVVASDGPPDAAFLDGLWRAYTRPVRARVE